MRDATLVFDLDGTLIDTAPDLIHAANHVLASRGLEPVAAERLKPEISFGARHIIAAGLRIRGVAFTEPELDAMLDRFLEFYADNMAVESRPFDGLLAALEGCLGEGATLAVCTNKREGLSRLLLEQLGLMRLFRAIAGRDTFPVCKPHPGHLLGAIRLAGGDPGRAVMVGDSEVDVSTAKAARIPIIGVTFGYTHIPVTELGTDAVIDGYGELRAALDGILARPA
ncbi:MAG: phosphoglycolate phosphatase [Hyphomicrobiaceae bacterium]|nr:phosphoglycolate phosphatase [Hyphomicrobiaceae bacterium]